MSKSQKPKEAPHIVKTIVTSNGVPVSIADNFCRDVSTEEMERRKLEARKIAWGIVRRAAASGQSI